MAQVFRYPAGSAVTITAIGPTGSPAPTTAIEVAGVDAFGDLRALQTDAAGNLNVNIANTSYSRRQRGKHGACA